MSKRSKRNSVTVRGPWYAMPLEMIRSVAFANLSPHAAKLFLDLCSQLGPNSYRNGDLTATRSVLKARGWTSTKTLEAARDELLEARLLALTRKGSKRRCSLYALTPWPLDCDLSKLDVKPGSYTCFDWTQGSKGLSEPPTEAQPARWNRPRKNSRPPATGPQTAVIDPPRG